MAPPMPSLSALPPLILVAFGGAAGSVLRYLVGGWAHGAFGPGFPFGTWAVNIGGGLAMGLLAGLLARGSGDEALRLLVGVGLLGGFTTFSAFSLELHTMILRGELGLGAAYAISSVAGSVLAVLAGATLARLV